MTFINLLKCFFFFNFIQDIPHWIVGLFIKGREKQFNIPLTFKRKLFCYQKLEKAFRKKLHNCFFFKSVCLFVGFLLFFLFSNKKGDGNQSVSVLSCFWNYKKWILATDQQGNVDYILLLLCPASPTYKNFRRCRIVDGLPLFVTQRSINWSI